MALYDIKASIDAPAQGTFQSDASQSQSLNLNPSFLFGTGNLTSSPSGASGASVTPTQESIPTQTNVPFAGGSVGIGATPPIGIAGAVPLGSSSGSSLWLIIALAIGAVLLTGGHEGRR